MCTLRLSPGIVEDCTASLLRIVVVSANCGPLVEGHIGLVRLTVLRPGLAVGHSVWLHYSDQLPWLLHIVLVSILHEVLVAVSGRHS